LSLYGHCAHVYVHSLPTRRSSDLRDLRAIIKYNRLNWDWARYLMQQICAGVEAIHHAGVVHRDLKASNCFYVEQTRLVKVLDFRSEEHTSELQSRENLVCRLLLEK